MQDSPRLRCSLVVRSNIITASSPRNSSAPRRGSRGGLHRHQNPGVLPERALTTSQRRCLLTSSEKRLVSFPVFQEGLRRQFPGSWSQELKAEGEEEDEEEAGAQGLCRIADADGVRAGHPRPRDLSLFVKGVAGRRGMLWELVCCVWTRPASAAFRPSAYHRGPLCALTFFLTYLGLS